MDEALAGWRNLEHGDLCDCRLLALAVGAAPSTMDYLYCRLVLQKHWRLHCNHGCRMTPPAVTPPPLPHLDPKDPLHAMLIANAPLPEQRRAE
ncbi:MAG TPA: hypothetical protein VIV54_13005 [Burkholderiales bacterium]|jgi:hypothetical protein